MNSVFFVYILKSLKDGRFYIGYTADLENRIARHNNGKNPSTKYRRPFELIYHEVYNTRQEAMAREKMIKSYKGGVAFQKLIADAG